MFALPLAVFAQEPERKSRVGSTILDDSTRNVYGPKTTLWTYEKDIFYNRPNYQPVDTSITNYHRWVYFHRFNSFYKDLGNNGTALSAIFPQLPSMIGITSGITVYEPFYATEEPRYFDTKSPYSRVHLIWGGQGRAMTRIEFSRNINERWNFGFNFRPLLTDKQIQRQRKGDRHVLSYYYDGYTGYRTKDDKYSIYVNFRRIRHRVKENGGVDTTGTVRLADGIFDDNARPFLSNTETAELRTNVHVFHQYRVHKTLQIYHTADRFKQRNRFFQLASDAAFFERQEYVKDTIYDFVQIKTFQNEVGVKGDLAKLFYNFYFKIRKWSLQNNRLQNNVQEPPGVVYDSGIVYSGYENYIGGRMSLEVSKSMKLDANAELLTDGNYKLEALLFTPWLDATFKNMQVKPGFMQNSFRGAHHFWRNSFDDPNYLQLTGFLKAKVGPLSISPGVTYNLFNNYIYFEEDTTRQQWVQPFQSGGTQQMVSPEVRLELALWNRIFFRPNIIYTTLLTNNDNALRIPEIFANAQLTFEGPMFKKNLIAQIGFDLHWNSAYYALGYNPAIQTYFNQNRIEMEPYPVVDVFINGQIKRGKFFFRFHNLMQAFRVEGYIPTPGYPAQRNILDFGFELLLFD